MAFNGKDEIPMLSDSTPQPSDEYVNSRSQAFTSRNRSASLSIPMHSLGYYENDTKFSGHTGPLRSNGIPAVVKRSESLYRSHKPKDLFLSNQGAADHQIGEPMAENLPSFSGVDQNDWSGENYASKNENLVKSGQLGMCNDPYCTVCPSSYNLKAAQHKHSRVSSLFDTKFHNALYGDAKGCFRRCLSSLHCYIPGIMNPHARAVQRWNKFFVVACLLAIFVDPLFFFLLSVEKDNKCIVIDWTMTKTFVVLRSIADFVQFLNMLLQFRLAYVAPESRIIGAGELVDHPKKIALNYLRGNFLIDLFVVLPLPQIMILLVIPKHLGLSGANYAKNLLRGSILVQYIPRLYRFIPLLAGQTPSGFIFESAWANFIMNLLTFMLASHVIGSCWYLLGLQRVNQCLRDACHMSRYSEDVCARFIDCGHGHGYNTLGLTPDPKWDQWRNNQNSRDCFEDGTFDYGIYKMGVNLTTESSIVTRYIYSLFWGFQQISTLAGNMTPSYFEWEVLFTMGIIGLGLLLFALLIGNIQNFLQALGRRRLEMSLRRRDVEQWMSHRRLPVELRRRVREAERYNWAATRGVDEAMLFKNMPEDLQRDIRRHLFKFIKNVRIFSVMDEPILDAISERLRQRTYISGSRLLCRGNLIEKMVFIVRGKMQSIGEDGTILPLSEGDVCGEELLSSCLEHSSVDRDGKKIRMPGKRVHSTRHVTCLTNVEALSQRSRSCRSYKSFLKVLEEPSRSRSHKV